MPNQEKCYEVADDSTAFELDKISLRLFVPMPEMYRKATRLNIYFLG
jgi:hypothetical protein